MTKFNNQIRRFHFFRYKSFKKTQIIDVLPVIFTVQLWWHLWQLGFQNRENQQKTLHGNSTWQQRELKESLVLLDRSNNKLTWFGANVDENEIFALVASEASAIHSKYAIEFEVEKKELT